MFNILIKMEFRLFFRRFQILIYVGNATVSRGTRKRKRWHISYTHFIQFVCVKMIGFASTPNLLLAIHVKIYSLISSWKALNLMFHKH